MKLHTALEQKIAFALGTVLMIYLIVRAYYVPFVHDEAATFFFYISNAHFIPEKGALDANNHFLNSTLSYLFYRLFGAGELSLRLASLLFFPVFFIFWFKLSGLLSTPFIRWAFLLSGLMANGMFEFFALCRGYGMSMALLSGGLWFFIKALREEKGNHFFLAILFLFLALYANLALLNTLVLLMAILTVYFIWKNNEASSGSKQPANGSSTETSNKNFAWIFWAVLLMITGIVFYALRLLDMQEGGSLYYGSGAGFWLVTVKSLMRMLVGSHNLVASGFVVVLTVFCGGGTLFLLVVDKRKISFLFTPAFVFSFLFFGNVIASVLLNKLFHVNYPEDRVGLYFLPLLICSICFVADALQKYKRVKVLSVITFSLFFLPVHFIYNLNASHTTQWDFENVPHRFYDKVSGYFKNGEAPPAMAGYRMRELTWAYQAYRHGGKAGMIYHKNFPDLKSDFQIAIARELGNWPAYYDRIDYDKASDLSLLKRKRILSRKLLCEIKGPSTSNGKDIENLELCTMEIDSLAWKNIYVKVQFRVQSPVKPFEGEVIFLIKDRDGNELRHERIPLSLLKNEWAGEKDNFLNGMQLLAIPENAHTFICTFRNWNKEMYMLTDSKCSIYELK